LFAGSRANATIDSRQLRRFKLHRYKWTDLAGYGYNTGIASTNAATRAGTSDLTLYRSNRYTSSSTPLIYNFL